MSTAAEHERKHDRLAIAEAYADYLVHPPNGLEADLFGSTNVVVNGPLALIQMGLSAQVDLLEKLARDELLTSPSQAPAQTDERLTVMDTEPCAYCGHSAAQHTDEGCQVEDLVKVTSRGKDTKLSRCGCDGYEAPAQTPEKP